MLLFFLSMFSLLNKVISFIVFSTLDVVDLVLCFVYKLVDFFIEAEWKPCYCNSPKEAITSSGKILVSEKGESNKIVCVSSSKLELEEISDTLYTRPSLVSEFTQLTLGEIKKVKIDNGSSGSNGSIRSSFNVNSTIVEMLQGLPSTIPRWSDCDCKFCNSWTSSCRDLLYVKSDGVQGKMLLFLNFN